ncbi:MAG: alpha-mannosidase [Candidatus Helarchaeota archaeon]
MEEYPFFTFSNTSPQYYYWTEELTPAIFERVKSRVAEGRFELIGGMWVEPDLNLVSGESLIRQRLYGQRYYLEKFGKPSTVAYLSDCFGYPWTLPQILKKSGAKYFYTNKMSWNDYSLFNFIAFHWKSPDGSSILTYCMPYSVNNFAGHPNVGDFDKHARFFPSESEFSYDTDPDVIKNSGSKDHIQDIGVVYGIGDGGGGPIREEIIFFKQLYKLGMCDFITMEEYFKMIEKEQDRLPIWNDEMYLETHRGVYTSHVWLKELNRKAEIDMQNVELLSTLMALHGMPYPKKRLEKLWKLILFNQFHDILPGSSIPEVYEDVRDDFKIIQFHVNKLLNGALEHLAKILQVQARSLLIFNSLSWDRSALIEIDDDNKLMDEQGNALPCQQDHSGTWLHLVSNVPAFGFKLVERGKSTKKSEFKSDLNIQENEQTIRIENQEIVAEIDRKTGNLVQLFSKSLQREFLTGEANKLRFFKDKAAQFPAWNIDKCYLSRPINFDSTNRTISCEAVEKGPLRICVKILEKFDGIEVQKQVLLLAHENALRFTLDVKGIQKETLIKLEFPFNIEANKISSEIACGVIDRHIRPKTKPQKGRWEISAHKWVDVSDSEAGVTLCNKTRFGHDAKYHPRYKSIVRMTIGRRPRYPKGGPPITSMIPSRKVHEQSEFHVEYWAVPHGKGSWKETLSFQKAHELNNPFITKEVKKSSGKLPSGTNFFKIEPPNVLLTALKQAEDDNQVILRLFETMGKQTTCTISFHESMIISDVKEVDLLELNPQKIKIQNEGEIKIKIKPFEIKTLKMKISLR